VGGDDETDITGNAAVSVGGNLEEKIAKLRQSIAGERQDIIAPVVWIGSEKVNAAQLMLDTLDLVQQLAQQLASHTHPSTGQPTNSEAIAAAGEKAVTLTQKYSPIIG